MYFIYRKNKKVLDADLFFTKKFRKINLLPVNNLKNEILNIK